MLGSFYLPLDQDFTLQVGAHEVRIRFISTKEPSSDEDPDVKLFGDTNHGMCDLHRLVVFISKDDTYSVRLSTFIHELMHVFEHLYQIKISHKDLNMVGEALAQILIQNFVKEVPDEEAGAT